MGGLPEDVSGTLPEVREPAGHRSHVAGILRGEDEQLRPLVLEAPDFT